MYKYEQIFGEIDNSYHLGRKMTLDDLKLLKVIYQGCDLVNSYGFFNTIYLMSMNNHRIPKKMNITERDRFSFYLYLKLKQENIHFTDDLKNIMEKQRYQKESHNHFNILYFLGIDFDKKVDSESLHSIFSQCPNMPQNAAIYCVQDFIDDCKLVLGKLMEGFLTKKLDKKDLDILKKYNYHVGMLFEDNYDILLKYSDSCSRRLGFSNEFLGNFETSFEQLAIAYLLNIEEYHYNPRVVGSAIEDVMNQHIEVSKNYLSRGGATILEKNCIFEESKKILNQTQCKLEQNNVVISQKKRYHS